MSFSERLRNAREDKGYTQQQIADIMGITKSTYCGYETGKRQPDVFKIKQICKILGVSGDVLLDTTFGNLNKNAPDEPKLTEGEELLIRLFRQIPEERQKVLLEMVRVFAESLKSD